MTHLPWRFLMKHDQPLEYSNAGHFVVVHKYDSELVDRRAVLKLAAIRLVFVLELGGIHKSLRARRRRGRARERRERVRRRRRVPKSCRRIAAGFRPLMSQSRSRRRRERYRGRCSRIWTGTLVLSRGRGRDCSETGRRGFGRFERQAVLRRLPIDGKRLDDSKQLLVRIDRGLLDFRVLVREGDEYDRDQLRRERDDDAGYDLQEFADPVQASRLDFLLYVDIIRTSAGRSLRGESSGAGFAHLER